MKGEYYRNESHCADPTAGMAIDSIKKKEKIAAIDRKAVDTLRLIRIALKLVGFKIDGELVIEHRASGRKYR